MSTPADSDKSAYTVFFDLQHPERLAPETRAMMNAAYALAKRLIRQLEQEARDAGGSGEVSTMQFYALLLAGSIIARGDGCDAEQVAAVTRLVAESIVVHHLDEGAAPS